MPECYEQLVKIRDILEKHYKDMQDIEFTIEKGKLFMLQTRNGKRTALAAIKIAVDMVKEGLIDEKTAVLRVAPTSARPAPAPLPRPQGRQERVIAKGLPAVPGAACGRNRVHRRRGRSMEPNSGEKSSWFGSKPRPKTSTA